MTRDDAEGGGVIVNEVRQSERRAALPYRISPKAPLLQDLRQEDKERRMLF